MNRNRTEGKFDQIKGKVKQSVGEAIGNEKLANSGAVDQVKGAANEAWGNAKDAARTVIQDHQARAEAKHAEVKQNAAGTVHDIREKITSTAQNVKNAVSDKAEQIKQDHRRSA